MSQADLFAPLRGRAAPPPDRPEPDAVRARLLEWLATARAAREMPWTPQRVGTLEHLFHNMANWLPEDERDGLRRAFAAELARLRRG